MSGTTSTGRGDGTTSVATSNACKLCAPLGASLAFRGVERALPFLHGSQGCSTYIRRYLIGHFREPVDIAASNFSEQAAIFGGGKVLTDGLRNVVAQYQPALIGVATTCLAETIGDDMGMLLNEAREQVADLPPVVSVATPSYAGTHAEGFHKTVRALVEQLAEGGVRGRHCVLLPGMVSPADLRHLRGMLQDYDLPTVILPDYSDTLDGQHGSGYQALPDGGTPVDAIRSTGRAAGCIAFGATLPLAQSAEGLLDERFSVPGQRMDWPIGVRATDRFCTALGAMTGRGMPVTMAAARGRLLDSYVDAHKYIAGRKVLLYGEEDLVVALSAFLLEIGMQPAVVGTGAASGRLPERLRAIGCPGSTVIGEDQDFTDFERAGRAAGVDLILGHSKGYWLAKRLERPLVRVGFPVHDRIGGARLQVLGYAGTQQLFDRIANTCITADQDANPVGYMCM